MKSAEEWVKLYKSERIEEFDPRHGYSSTHYTDTLARFNAKKGQQ